MKMNSHSEEFRVVMAFGDSITAGGNANARERCWANELVRQLNEYQRTPANLINLGIGANLISVESPAYAFSGKPAGDERVRQHILNCTTNGRRQAPDLLVIALCQNDARSGTPVASYVEMLDGLLSQIRNGLTADCEILICGPYHLLDFTPEDPIWGKANPGVLHAYNEAIMAFCEHSGCLFVDLLAAMAGADWLMHQDKIHLNDLGHRVVANAIFNRLATHYPIMAQETTEVEKQAVFWRDEAKLQ